MFVQKISCRSSFRRFRTVALRGLFFGTLTLGALGNAPVSMGSFALQAAAPQTNGHLVVHAGTRDPLRRSLDFWMSRKGETAPLRRYDLDMTRRIHLVIVSDDFATFQHVHPRLTATGHFELDQRFERAALYHLYFDGEPYGIGQQVFRFDVAVGTPRSKAVRALSPSGTTAHAGPYEVSLGRTRLSAHEATMLHVRIDENGKPARDLHPYLGTPTHAVFLNANDLTYVHVHPMILGRRPGVPSSNAMVMNESLSPAAAVAPDMLLHVEVHEAGTYKLWMQFRGKDTLRVASFILTAS